MVIWSSSYVAKSYKLCKKVFINCELSPTYIDHFMQSN